MKDGYIKLHRKVLDSAVYKESDYLSVWVHCLMRAGYKDKEMIYNNRKLIIKRGQFIISRKKMAKETGVQESKVERVLKYLKSEQMIEQQNLHTSRLITIINYDKYQSHEQVDEQPVNSQRTASEQPVNTIKKDKKDKKDKNKNKPLALNDKNHRPKPPKINFDFKTSKWENIKPEDIKIWTEAYPACDMKIEFAKMTSWLLSNPSKKKSNYKKFINNWLSRTQDKGGTRGIPDEETWAERSERKERGKK